MPTKITPELEIKMRDEFIFGYVAEDGERKYPTIEALQRRHDVAIATLRRKADKGDWQKEKNRRQTELQDKLDAERLERLVEGGKRLDDNALQIAQAMLTRVGRKLQRAFRLEEDDPDVERLGTDEMRELSQVTINAQKVGKLALGEAQEISKVSADVSNPEAFQEVMEQLDEIAAARSSRVKHTLQ